MLHALISSVCTSCSCVIQLRNGDLGLKFSQVVKADLAGLATADIGEVRPCGTVRFTPLQFAPGVQI
jgi:hypothetical protein